MSSISQTATIKTVTNKTDITTQNFLKFLVPANPAVVERVSVRSRLKRGQETAVASLGLRGKRRIKHGEATNNKNRKRETMGEIVDNHH